MSQLGSFDFGDKPVKNIDSLVAICWIVHHTGVNQIYTRENKSCEVYLVICGLLFVFSLLYLPLYCQPFDLWCHMTSYQRQYINVRGYRRDNQKQTIQRNWQHREHKTKKNKTKTQHNMLEPLCANKHKLRK